jgi:hypothetical protein
VTPEVGSILDKYKHRLLPIFEYYCSFGENENTTRLKRPKYVKMLRECDIIEPLKVILLYLGTTK